MSAFIVTVTETLTRSIPVENVEASDEALEAVMRQYKNVEIVLDSNDFTGVKYSVEQLEDNSSC